MTEWEIRYNLVDWKNNPYAPDYGKRHQNLTEEEKERYKIPDSYHWEEVLIQVEI